MSAAFVRSFEKFPEAGPFALEVINDEGDYANLFSPGQAEVTLIEKQGHNGEHLVVSVRFDTLEQAKRAGKTLADAFEAVREIQAEAKPEPCYLHRWRVSLFSRSVEHKAVCARCGAVADLVVRDADA